MKEKMVRTKFPKAMSIYEPIPVLKRIKMHIHAYNKNMSYVHMATKNIVELLNNCHPLDRDQFALEAHKAGLLTEYQYRHYLKYFTLVKDHFNDGETTVRTEEED